MSFKFNKQGVLFYVTIKVNGRFDLGVKYSKRIETKAS